MQVADENFKQGVICIWEMAFFVFLGAIVFCHWFAPKASYCAAGRCEMSGTQDEL